MRTVVNKRKIFLNANVLFTEKYVLLLFVTEESERLLSLSIVYIMRLTDLIILRTNQLLKIIVSAENICINLRCRHFGH